MDKLYDLVISNQELTKSQLIKNGLALKDIKDLIEKGKLKESENGLYKFVSIHELFFYGKSLLGKKETKKAKLCFLKCLEINPKHNSSAFCLLTISIREEIYEDTFKYLEILINGNDYNQNDNNLYLYLLSFIIKLPDKYQMMVKNMLTDDVEHRGNDFYVTELNIVRNLILRNKFSLALRKLTNLIEKEEKIHASDFITRKLLKEVIKLKSITEEKLNELIKTKDYEGIIKLLESRPNLGLSEEYILKLSYIYIGIGKNKKIPTSNLEYTPDFFMAIDRNNFELALKINKDSDDIFSIILNDLVNRIAKEKIFINLQNQDLDESFKLLNEYLIKINQTEYEKSIINIVRLCIVKNDVSFIKLRELLDLLENNGVIDVGYYVEKFYMFLTEKNYEEAKFCISIIDNLEPDNSLVNQLKKELDKSRNTSLPKQVKNDKPKRSYKNQTNPVITIDPDLINNPDYIFLEQKSKEIEEEKIIIITDNKQIKTIKRLIRCFPNMQFFSIGNNKIVLKLKRNEFINFKELNQKGYDAFSNKKYQEAIEYYELLNSLSNKNTAICYSRLGWSYFYLKKYEMALKYFIVADSLNKIEGKVYPLDKQIRYLEKIINNGEFSKDNETEKWLNSSDEDMLQDIVDLINANSMSIDEACLKFNLDEINTNIVKLIIARDCYIQQDYVTGDKLLKSVERSNHKNKKIIDLLNEIRTNRLFYKNREEKQTLISNPKVLKH